MPVVVQLLGRVDPRPHLEPLRTAGHLRDHAQRRAHGQRVTHALDVVLLEPGEPERLPRLPVGELERQHAHPHQVRAMDALERLSDDGPDA